MELQEVGFAGHNLVEAYGDGGFRMEGRRIDGSILILPGIVKNLVHESDTLPDYDVLAETLIGQDEIEIVILGTGPKQIFPPAGFAKRLAEKKLALETMDTGAACRTYNILVSEDRQVAAALIAI